MSELFHEVLKIVEETFEIFEEEFGKLAEASGKSRRRFNFWRRGLVKVGILGCKADVVGRCKFKGKFLK